MFCTSVYSLSDKIAVYYMPGITAQLGYVSIAYFVALAVMSLEQYRTTGSLIPNCRPGLTACLTGGVTIGVSYALIINAMQYIPVAYVIVYTNASIVIASLISIVLLGEREHMRVRLLSTAVIIFGLSLVSFA